MSQVATIEVDPRDARRVQGPYLRIELEGGCGLLGCACTPEPFVLISNGETMLSVSLTRTQVAALLKNRGVSLTLDNGEMTR